MLHHILFQLGDVDEDLHPLMMATDTHPEAQSTSCITVSDINEAATSHPSNNTLTTLMSLPLKQENSSTDIVVDRRKVSFMGFPALLHVLLTEQCIATEITSGKKENMYIVINNTSNVKRRCEGKRSRFTDDCGVWDSRKTSTRMEFYIYNKQTGDTTACVRRDSLYGRMDKNVFYPFAVQPSEDDMIVCKKAASHLKRKPDYRRRVTWLEKVPELINLTLNKAVVEYTGTYSTEESYHGNMKNFTHSYRRLPDKLRDELLQIVPYVPLKDAYRVISEKTGYPIDAQTMKIALNLKYHGQPRKRLRTTKGNNYDKSEILGRATTINTNSNATEKVESSVLADSDHTTIYIYTDEQWDTINEALNAKTQ